MLPNQAECCRHMTSAEAVVLRKSDLRLKPELRLATRSLHMDVGSFFLP